MSKIEKQMNTKEPRILLFDIETAPNLGYVWAKYEQNVIEYESEWYMLCFAYKWLGEKTVYAKGLHDYKLYKKEPDNDRELVKDLWKLFNEADIIIAHNGNSFDIKKTNARFLVHGLKPPSPYKTIDTKLVAKRYFNFNSNKLDDLGRHLGVGRKVDTGGFDLWMGCMTGDISSWRKMIRYNKMDVSLLERVYNIVKPWIVNHPNVGLYRDTKHACPNCGGEHLQKRGLARTRVSTRQRYQCVDCGAWSQGETIKTTGVQIR